MTTALLYGMGTGLPLVVGAWIGLHWNLPRKLLAALLAFGAGTMVAAVSAELFEPAFEELGAWGAGAGLLGGAGFYVVANHLIEQRLGSAALGWSLMLGSVLDGVPENAALGVTLSEAGGVVLLVAVAVGNTPEAIGGAAKMREQHGFNQRRALLLWSTAAALLVAVVVISNAAADVVSAGSIASLQAVAGGATIAVLADTLMPEAYEEGGWWVGLATAMGFLVAFSLGA
ncbi:MAG: hypothetical protein WKF82_02510 [Nocardioidaceae bacterium]